MTRPEDVSGSSECVRERDEGIELLKQQRDVERVHKSKALKPAEHRDSGELKGLKAIGRAQKLQIRDNW